MATQLRTRDRPWQYLEGRLVSLEEFATASTSGSHSYASCEIGHRRVDSRGHRTGTRAHVSRCPGQASVRHPHTERVSASVSEFANSGRPTTSFASSAPGLSAFSAGAEVPSRHSGREPRRRRHDLSVAEARRSYDAPMKSLDQDYARVLSGIDPLTGEMAKNLLVEAGIIQNRVNVGINSATSTGCPSLARS
jgi:hypothetical protein